MRLLACGILAVSVLAHPAYAIGQAYEIEKVREIPLDLGDEIVGRIVDVVIGETGRF